MDSKRHDEISDKMFGLPNNGEIIRAFLDEDVKKFSNLMSISEEEAREYLEDCKRQEQELFDKIRETLSLDPATEITDEIVRQYIRKHTEESIKRLVEDIKKRKKN